MTSEIFSSLNDAVIPHGQLPLAKPSLDIKVTFHFMWLMINIFPLAQDRGAHSSCRDVLSPRLLLFQGLSRTLWSEVTDPPCTTPVLAGLWDARGFVA